jgi:hypothetical protein
MEAVVRDETILSDRLGYLLFQQRDSPRQLGESYIF